jgi:hypothetical protein
LASIVEVRRQEIKAKIFRYTKQKRHTREAEKQRSRGAEKQRSREGKKQRKAESTKWIRCTSTRERIIRRYGWPSHINANGISRKCSTMVQPVMHHGNMLCPSTCPHGNHRTTVFTTDTHQHWTLLEMGVRNAEKMVWKQYLEVSVGGRKIEKKQNQKCKQKRQCIVMKWLRF